MSPLAARQNELLDALEGDEAVRAGAFAARVRALAELAALAEQDGGVEQFAGMELAGTCRLGRLAAEHELVRACRYVEALPLTLQAMARGDLFVHQGETIRRTTESCTEDVARRVEQLALEKGGIGLCPPDLRRILRRFIAQVESELDSDAATRRLQEARQSRRVSVRPLDDGMALIRASGPGEQVVQWQRDMDRLVLQEKALDRAAGAWRSSDQIRADLVLAMPGMLLKTLAEQGMGPRSLPAADTLINVFVPVSTLLEHTSEPADLEGYGPISAEHVRLLLPDARLRRACVDHETGRPLFLDPEIASTDADADRSRQRLLAMIRPVVATDTDEPQHDPSARLSRFLRVRDVRCAGPGCTLPARRCQLDHTRPYPHGPTAARNLAGLSASCHRAKHSGWHLSIGADGSATWVSPLGRTYLRPPPHQPPQLPSDHSQLGPRTLPPPPAGGGTSG